MANLKTVTSKLFSSGTNTYAVLDGASVPHLLEKIYEFGTEHICLYRGELEPDLAETAPYLVQLVYDSDFTNWMFERFWGKHWGIFALSKVDMRAMRQHFRKFLMVKGPEGEPLYFRYYDPRVLRVYLPTCDEDELEVLFGPVNSYLVEGEEDNQLLEYTCTDELKLFKNIVNL